MRIPTLPSTVAHRLQFPMSLRGRTPGPYGISPDDDEPSADGGDFEDAVDLNLSDAARDFIGKRRAKTGPSPAQRAFMAIHDGVAPPDMSFGEIVKDIVRGRDFHAEAAARAAQTTDTNQES